jgi:hypothetical protein
VRRRCEQDFWADFARDYAHLLGGLLDAVSAGMRLWPEVRLPELPRMADAVRWGESVTRGLGWAPDTFVTAYNANRRSATQEALEDSPLANLLFELVRLEGAWRGTATELLQLANQLTHGKRISERGWPKSPMALSSALRRLAPQLRVLGIAVLFDRDRNSRAITIKGFGEIRCAALAPA